MAYADFLSWGHTCSARGEMVPRPISDTPIGQDVKLQSPTSIYTRSSYASNCSHHHQLRNLTRIIGMKTATVGSHYNANRDVPVERGFGVVGLPLRICTQDPRSVLTATVIGRAKTPHLRNWKFGGCGSSKRKNEVWATFQVFLRSSPDPGGPVVKTLGSRCRMPTLFMKTCPRPGVVQGTFVESFVARLENLMLRYGVNVECNREVAMNTRTKYLEVCNS